MLITCQCSTVNCIFCSVMKNTHTCKKAKHVCHIVVSNWESLPSHAMEKKKKNSKIKMRTHCKLSCDETQHSFSIFYVYTSKVKQTTTVSYYVNMMHINIHTLINLHDPSHYETFLSVFKSKNVHAVIVQFFFCRYWFA